MSYKIKIVQVDYTGKQSNNILLEEGINEALKNIKGTVIKIDNWSRDSLRAALIAITYKEE